jgi:Tfp pilus assembly protein PilN
MILSGNLERAPVFKEELRSYFKIPVDTVVVEKSDFILWEKKEQMWMRLKQFRISITALLGLSLERKEPFVNLVPEEFKNSALRQVRNKQATGSLLLVAGILILSLLCGFAYLQVKESQLQYILSQLTDNRQQSKGLVNMMQKLDMIQDFSLKRLQGLEVLAELHRVLPSDVILNSVNCDLAGEIKIRGLAKTTSQVTDLLIALQQSQSFTKEELVSSRERKLRREEVVEFSIQCRLRK